MVSRQTAKVKGAAFEYDCQESLEVIYEDIYRTSERGFQQQYDLRSDTHQVVFECKRLAGISWNQAVKFFKKLKTKAPKGYDSYLLFKSNRQPCLVMYEGNQHNITINTFEDHFRTDFVKHKSTRNRL